MDLEIRALSQDDGCNALSLGSAGLTPLKAFLRGEAKRLHRANLARTFVAVERGRTRIYGYVTMVCTHIAVERIGGPAPVDAYRYDDYPAVKLARLAVDVSLQQSGLGSRLVDLVIGFTTEFVMPHVGCRFMVVDAKARSASFYARKGFTRMGCLGRDEDAATTMVIDLHRVPAAKLRIPRQ